MYSVFLLLMHIVLMLLLHLILSRYARHVFLEDPRIKRDLTQSWRVGLRVRLGRLDSGLVVQHLPSSVEHPQEVVSFYVRSHLLANIV